jgi:dUTP pyrophosphatase
MSSPFVHAVLNRQEIENLIKEKNLITGYIDLATQLTPNGFDLTVESVYAFDGLGALDFSNKERLIPDGKAFLPEKKNPQDKFGWWHLQPGTYKVKTNETVTLDLRLVAFAFPRSSLLRAGVFTQTGVWDAGFSGRSEFVLVVGNPRGVSVKQNARLVQLVFARMDETKEGYQGRYQNKA